MTTVDEQLEILKQRDSNVFALNGAGMTLCVTSSVMMAATPPWFVRDDDLSESEDTRRGTSMHEYPGGTQRFSDTSSLDECQVSTRRKTSNIPFYIEKEICLYTCAYFQQILASAFAFLKHHENLPDLPMFQSAQLHLRP